MSQEKQLDEVTLRRAELMRLVFQDMQEQAPDIWHEPTLPDDTRYDSSKNDRRKERGQKKIETLADLKKAHKSVSKPVVHSREIADMAMRTLKEMADEDAPAYGELNPEKDHKMASIMLEALNDMVAEAEGRKPGYYHG